MNLSDLLQRQNIDPREVIVFRHRPREPQLNKVIGWLAEQEPDLFNAYQQTQGERVEKAMLSARYVASFLRHAGGYALFVGLYRVASHQRVTQSEYWQVPAFAKLRNFGMGWPDERASIAFFELGLEDFYAEWKGKLIIRGATHSLRFRNSSWYQSQRASAGLSVLLPEAQKELSNPARGPGWVERRSSPELRRVPIPPVGGANASRGLEFPWRAHRPSHSDAP